MKLPKAKIEDRAISVLENIINEHPTMQHNFRRMDKEMSWDGDIWIYKSETEQSKKTFDDKVPVQIKGHIDGEEKYLSEDRISYPVELEDLEVYFKSTGVLYFLVFMSENVRKRTVFYASLFPSKVKAYLEAAEKKGNTKTKSIPFVRLKETPENIYIVVKQFSMESRNQGFGVGPVVKNTITKKNTNKVDKIITLAVGAGDECEFFEKLSTGDVCMYGITEGDPVPYPLEWDDDRIKAFKREADKAVEIKRTIRYIEQ